VRFPTDVDQTAHYRGTAITYMDQSTLMPLATPKREPLTLDRHVEVVGSDFSHAVIQETITIRTGSTTTVEHYRYTMDRRSMKFSGSGNYAFEDPKNTMHAGGSYRVNFAMGTTTDGSYLAYIPEADAQVPLKLVRGPHHHADAGVTVIDFSSKLETPVAPYYLQHLKDIGLPMEVTAAQLQPQLLAAGIDIGKALSDIGPRLTSDQAALLSSTLAKPVPLKYFFVVDGLISIEPKTGALVDVHSTAEGVAVQPDMSGASALQPLLDEYSSIPSVKAASDGLAKLAVRTPQPAQMLEYQQTPASSRAIAQLASDQGRMMTIATWWVPIGLALLGAGLVVLGVIGRRRAGKGRPGAPVDTGAEPEAPTTPPPARPLEPVHTPAGPEPDRVPEPV
jgi:Porin PorA